MLSFAKLPWGSQLHVSCATLVCRYRPGKSLPCEMSVLGRGIWGRFRDSFGSLNYYSLTRNLVKSCDFRSSHIAQEFSLRAVTVGGGGRETTVRGAH